MKERPVADEVQCEEIAAHAVVEAGVAEDEVPFVPRGDFGGAFEGLEGLFAELLVEDDERWVVG